MLLGVGDEEADYGLVNHKINPEESIVRLSAVKLSGEGPTIQQERYCT